MANAVYYELYEPFSINNYYSRRLPFLEIKGDNYKARYSSFKEIQFESLVHFENTNLTLGLYFDKCTFKGPVVFSNIATNGVDDLLNPDGQSIVFKDCTFSNIVRFEGKDSVIERAILIEGCQFQKGLLIQYLNIGFEGLTIK